jgi:flagellar export protein FliJ
MATFRFRAAVVLDLRVREEQAALALRSQAEARFREAVGAVAATEARRHASQQELASLERRGSDLGAILWHRNWIDRLRALVELACRDRDDRQRELTAADARWRDTRRRRLAIERLRDRAWRRFQKDEARREQKEMDELARIRHLAAELDARSESGAKEHT